jgi:thiol-disulfide isomerase/thioredoxin
MKKILFLLLTISTFQFVYAQAPEVSRDAVNGSKILKGFFTKQDLATDTAFAWFAENQKGYTPQQKAIEAFRSNKDSINIIAFAGTWCSDTKTILPQFFALTDAAGFSQDRITILGVDRNKKTIQHLSEAFNITNVPTLVVMKNGKEIGRVVEYGKYGLFDKELAEIVSASAK